VIEDADLDDLTQQTLRLLSILLRNGDWMNRSAIAHELHKGRLNHYDIQMLEKLHQKELISVREYLHRGCLTAFEYRSCERSDLSVDALDHIDALYHADTQNLRGLYC
jgi:hypothetical protein